MKTLRTLALATAVSAGLLGSTGVYSADDGDLGSTSTGNFDINLNIPGNVAIWGMRDLPFTDDGTKILEACVFSSTDEVQFQVNTTNNEFELKSGAIKGADFTVTITDGTDSTLWGSGGLASGDTSSNNFDVSAASEPSNTAGVIDSVCTGDDQTIDINVAVSNVTDTEGAYTSNVELVVSAI
ncbi:hypothetical protein [Endozoicomonas sp. SESOKO1]|uniref:hypothetical protein n=1 Tax=Endozoicomonas sp. SESOKO1 TaxID=2828742 RepID=UPI0021478608|nr:hypothetical protein [Endozoicomonas sp. SESOKO1]